MPFEQKYTPETREASLARVLERRESEPGNRGIIRETADEFQVGEQSLRGWIRAHEKANAPAEPEISEPEPTPDPAPPAAASPVATEAPAAPRRGPGRPSAAANAEARVAELEAEVAKLRRDRDALKGALAVLLDD
jgi:transposase-like protein